MNRNFYISLLLIAGAGRGFAADNSDAAPSPPPKVSLSTLLTDKNIFSATRGRTRYTEMARPKVVRTFTFHGTVDTDIAFFTGEGVARGYVKVGDMLNGFKVMKIPLSYTDPTVILTDPSGTIVVLKNGDSMRREDEGPWARSDEPAPLVLDTTASSNTNNAAAAPGGSSNEPPMGSDGRVWDGNNNQLHGAARETEVLRRLRLKREQEDK